MIQTTSRGVAILLAAALACIGAGCAAHGAPPTAGNRKYIFVDKTVGARQRAAFGQPAHAVIGGLRSGDTLRIFAVHDRTGDAAPLFSSDLPVLPARPTSRQLAGFNKARAEAIAGATAALENVLAGPVSASGSDIFSIFDRCRAGGDPRPSSVFVFSDMLQVSKETNFERQPLVEHQFPQFITKVAGQHNWDNQSLAGTLVFVLLPDGGDLPRVANGRAALERFYSSLIGSLGGRLARFETHFEKGDVQ